MFQKKVNALFQSRVILKSNWIFSAILSLFLMTVSTTLNAQVIFSEPFDEADGSTTGTDNTGGVVWNSVCPSCLTGDHFEVQAGQLEGQDTNGPASWETGAIDISSCGFIEIEFSISSQGTMEACGTGCNSVDWVQLEYNIDGTGWQTPGNSTFCAGACADLNVIQSDDVVGGTTLYTTGCIEAGNTIQLRITVQAWAGDEFWRIDNVTLSCTTGPTADAGDDVSICSGGSVILNGSGTGTPTWSPPTNLSSTSVFDPVASPVSSTTYTLTVDASGCTASDDVTVSIITVDPIVVSSDVTICDGDCVDLTVSGGDFFTWDAGTDIIDPALTTQNVCPSATETYQVTSFTIGSNLIINGDFSAGNTGFSSSYSFTNPTNTGEAQYNVIPDPQTFNGAFSPCDDHTTGTGNMMVVNGSSVLGSTVWCQTIAVTPNTDYLFSSWLASVHPTNPAILQFTINGIAIGSDLNASATTCDWQEFFATWNSGINTSATICITNLNTNVVGNDFALDDISFSTVCEQTASVTVTVNDSPSMTAETDLEFCDGETTLLNSFVSSPAGATFNWTNSNTAIGLGANGSGSIPSFTATNAGATPITATIEVTPSFGSCIGTADEFTITVNPIPDVDAGTNQTICEGQSVTLTAANPDGATISWDNGVTDGVAFTPGVGVVTYTSTATDASSGCENSDAVTVTVIDVPNVTINPAGPFSTTSGTQNLIASPGSGIWSSDCGACINSITGVFDPAIAGEGTWEICYEAGVSPCDDSDCINIIVSNTCIMDGIISANNPTCFGFTDGSVTINISGAFGTPDFNIENSSGTVVNIGNSNTANNLAEGWYYFEVTDEASCVVIDSVFIDAPDEMSIQLQTSNPTCYGLNNGYAFADTVLNYTGDYADISYFWNPNPSGLNGVGEDSLQQAGAGNYSLLINDDNGCAVTLDFNLVSPDSLYFSEIGHDPAFCRMFYYQSGNGVVYAAAAGGTPDYTYQWVNLSTGVTSNNTTWGGLNPAEYQITVTDDNGCTLVETILMDSLNPIAAFTLESADFTALYEGNAVVDVHFENQSQNFANPNDPTADTTFFWHFGFPDQPWVLSEDILETFDISYTEKGDYTVCLVALNKNGCSDTACTLIQVYDPFLFTPVNVFTPDEDGTNDSFSFDDRSSSIEQFSCVIVDRWGVVVFEFDSIDDVWNGNNKNGTPCTAGVYFYTYELVSFNGIQQSGQGTIHLIK